MITGNNLVEDRRPLKYQQTQQAQRNPLDETREQRIDNNTEVRIDNISEATEDDEGQIRNYYQNNTLLIFNEHTVTDHEQVLLRILKLLEFRTNSRHPPTYFNTETSDRNVVFNIDTPPTIIRNNKDTKKNIAVTTSQNPYDPPPPPRIYRKSINSIHTRCNQNSVTNKSDDNNPSISNTQRGPNCDFYHPFGYDFVSCKWIRRALDSLDRFTCRQLGSSFLWTGRSG